MAAVIEIYKRSFLLNRSTNFPKICCKCLSLQNRFSEVIVNICRGFPLSFEQSERLFYLSNKLDDVILTNL